jgi:flavin reductase (DIM6/NTAB) family NADH-FMN oxidoreductase RutF
MAIFSANSIQTWERSFRANFVNSLTGFKSVSLIGTVNIEGQTNLAIYSSIVHIGSNPPLIGFINRPDKGGSHTLSNIRSSGVYTLNHIQTSFLEQAHKTSVKYPAGVSEFEQVGLTPENAGSIAAPFVKESRIKYALSLKEIIPIPLNDTSLVIGTILEVHLEEQVFGRDGFIELDKAHSICSNGNDAYYAAEFISRYL